MFITFEGIDFCGKSVQVELLQQKCVNLGKKVIVIREPGGTLIAEKIRQVLLAKESEPMNPVAELLLYSAARAQLVQQQIIPNLKAGQIIICDRYFDSTTAYQGYGRGIDLATINQIHQLATQEVLPDLTFIIDIDLDEVERRKKKVNTTLDRMEIETKTFFEKVRQGYLTIAEQYPKRIKVINGQQPIPNVAQEIWNYLQGVIYV
jgi:dTMP kinase